jgi:mannosyltransferase
MNFEKSGYIPAYTPRQAGWRRRLPPIVNRGLGFFTIGVQRVTDRVKTYLSNRRNRRRIRRIILLGILIALPFYLEILYHASTFRIVRPKTNLDPPFNEGCADVKKAAKENERANAAVVMLAKNGDIEGATLAVSSFEKRFNQYFNYPIIFMNDEFFDDDFKKAMKKLVSGDISFERIPPKMWGYPEWMSGNDQANARESMRYMSEEEHMPHAGSVGYHHMCRYESG